MITDFFNRAATIYKLDQSGRDATGFRTTDEAELHRDEPCCISPQSTMERAMHGSKGVETTHKMWVSGRLAGLLDTSMKVRSNGQVFDIIGIEDPQYRGRHVLLTLREVEGNG